MLKNERLLSLDVFRGITIFAMILVNNPGSWSFIYPPLKHAEWHGCTPTDFIFPFFLFIVGVAITFSLSNKKEKNVGINGIIIQILKRSIILFILGLFLNTFPIFDFALIRIPGVLQRIAIVYFISSILFLKVNFKYLPFIGAGFLLVYWGLMTLIPVPNVGYANLEPTKNLSAYIDNLLLNGHLWKYSKVWDTEGILGTIPAISTTILGIITGKLLKRNIPKMNILKQLLISGTVLTVIGLIWNIWFPINKNLWTSSYVLFTGGIAIIIFGICYFLIDIKKISLWSKPFEIYGLNAITVYFLSGIMTLLMYHININSDISLHEYLFNILFSSWVSPINASLLWAITYVLFWLGIMWIFYKKEIFIKV